MNRNLSNLIIFGTECFDATQTIVVGGNESYVTIMNGGNATLIAGQNILMYPSTTVNLGGHLLAYITSNGTYCGMKSPSMVTATGETSESIVPVRDTFLKVYPNPTRGSFNLEITSDDFTGEAHVDIYTSLGDKVLSKKLVVSGIHELSLDGNSGGVYYVRVFSGKRVLVTKIILSR